MLSLQAEALRQVAVQLTHAPWEPSGLLDAARMAPHLPSSRTNAQVVEADALLNAAYWRILSLCAPDMAAQRFAILYAKCKEALDEELELSREELNETARTLAGLLQIEGNRLASSNRVRVPPRAKRDLLYSAETPRCWYCGTEFSQSEIARFLGDEVQGTTIPPVYVDFTAPRGLGQHDLRIEVDHLQPHSRLGSDDIENLRLSCGWCNRHKSSLSILTDAEATPQVIDHPRLGRALAPRPFWVVRVLGTTRECRVCQTGIDTAALVVAPRRVNGAMVPGNLGVYCAEHDPMSFDRLVPTKSLVRGRAAG